jgi:hypothetical protein
VGPQPSLQAFLQQVYQESYQGELNHITNNLKQLCLRSVLDLVDQACVWHSQSFLIQVNKTVVYCGSGKIN